MLDGAAQNAPVFDETPSSQGQGSGKRQYERIGEGAPPKPDPRKFPHDASGWELKYDPIMSKGHGLTHEQIDAKVEAWKLEDARNGG